MSWSEDGLESSFTFESERGREVEDVPFRVLVLGDWTAAGEQKPLADRQPIEIDRDNFDAVIGRIRPRVELSGEGLGNLSLEFTSLDDFHPDEIFRRLLLFGDLRDLRKRLRDENTYNEAAREVRSWLKQNPDASPPTSAALGETASSGSLLDSILSNPEGGTQAPRLAPSGELGSFISEIVRPHLVSVDENQQNELVSAVDEATRGLMRKILHDHAFQALEAAWRGLYFLARRAETSTDLKIYIFDVSKEELVNDLESVSDLADSKLSRILIEDTVNTPGADPWSVIAGNYAFLPSIDDVAALLRIGKLASAANAPFISHMRPEVLGVKSLHENADAASWKIDEFCDEAKLWSALRNSAESEYLGMTMPRVLARLPYGYETNPLESFALEEFSGGPKHDEYLWMNGCFAAALLLARSFSAYGWEMGRNLMQDLEDLPLHIYKAGSETIYQPCGEALLTQSACERLMEYGLMPIVSYKNTDKVKLARFQSIGDPPSALGGRWTT
jgi:type VI secretion system protein ImpC